MSGELVMGASSRVPAKQNARGASISLNSFPVLPVSSHATTHPVIAVGCAVREQRVRKTTSRIYDCGSSDAREGVFHDVPDSTIALLVRSSFRYRFGETCLEGVFILSRRNGMGVSCRSWMCRVDNARQFITA